MGVLGSFGAGFRFDLMTNCSLGLYVSAVSVQGARDAPPHPAWAGLGMQALASAASGPPPWILARPADKMQMRNIGLAVHAPAEANA